VNQQAEPSAPIAPASSDTRQARNTSITTVRWRRRKIGRGRAEGTEIGGQMTLRRVEQGLRQ
jgi:hypothetical protein